MISRSVQLRQLQNVLRGPRVLHGGDSCPTSLWSAKSGRDLGAEMAPLCAICLFWGLAGCGLSERTLLLKRSLLDHGTAAVWRPGIASSLRKRRRHCKDHHCVTASAGGKVVDAGRCLAASACVCATEAPCVPVIYIIPSPCAVLTSVPHCAHTSRYWVRLDVP